MLKKLTITLAIITLPLVMFACEVFSVDTRVQPRPNPTPLNHTFDVQIKVLLDDSCDFASQTHRFYVWTVCGEHYTEVATITKSRPISSSEFSCINTSQLSDTTLREFTLAGTFTLNNSHCPGVRTYFEYGSQTFYNIEDYDSLTVPVAGWVDFNGSLRRDTLSNQYTNAPHITDSIINLIGACDGNEKTISPMVSDLEHDSLFIEVTKVCWVDTTSDSFPTIKSRNFLGFYNKSYPFPSTSYSVIKKFRRINFVPSDTGLYAIPTYSKEYDYDYTFNLWYLKYKAYRLIPLFVSNQCTPPNQEAFAYDTIQVNCQQGKVYIPLQAMAHPGSISSDGSDLKFHNANGYPVLISEARAKDFHASYTDSLELDVQFLFDGYYEVQLLQGADGNRLIDDCGYELNGNTRIMLHVSNCPVASLADYTNFAFSVFPNPAKNHITISGESNISAVSIFGLSGQKLHETELESSKTEFNLPLKESWKGVHLLKIQNEEGAIFTTKLMIE